MNKGFDETPLNNFKDKEDFLSGWRGHAEKLTNSQANCHKLRVELLEKFKRFDIEIDGRATIEIELGCPYSKAEISQREYGIWFSVCKDYHRISAEYIYDGCLSKLPKGANPGAFDCPVCNAKVRSLKEFKLDYITYNYYSIMEDGKSTMQITARQLAGQAEIPRNENQTNIPSANKTVTWVVERLPNLFKQFLQNNAAIQTFYEKELRVRDENVFLDKLTPDRPGALMSVSLLCAATQKRILFPVMHKNCKHHSITIFDLYSIMPTLHKQRAQKKSVACPVRNCTSKFTFDDLEREGIYDSTLRSLVRKEPLYNVTMFFSLNGNVKKHEFQWEDKTIDERVPEQIRNKLRNNKKYQAEVAKQVKRFFRFNKIQGEKYAEKLGELAEKSRNGQSIIKIQLPGAIKAFSVPVRCIKCLKFEDVRDLWHYNSLVVKDEKANLMENCPICTQSYDNEPAESCTYIDYRMWEFTKQGFLNLVFYNSQRLYNVDIEKINHTQIRDVLIAQNRVIQPYPQTTPDFQKTLNLTLEDLASALPLVLESCKAKCNGDMAALIKQHLVLKRKDQGVSQTECPSCRNKPTDIVNVLLETEIEAVMRKGKLRLAYNQKAKTYVLAKHLKDFPTLSALLDQIKNSGRIMDLKPGVVVNIIRQVRKDDELKTCLIQYPVVVLNCQCKKTQQTYHQYLLDLNDIYGKGAKIEKCPSCKASIKDLSLDDILFFPKLNELLLNRADTNPNFYQNGAIFEQTRPGHFRLDANLQVKCRVPGLYDKPKDIYHSQVISLSDKVTDELAIIEREFKKRLDQLPKEIQKNPNKPLPHNINNFRTAGGINIFKGRVLPAFDAVENRA